MVISFAQLLKLVIFHQHQIAVLVGMSALVGVGQVLDDGVLLTFACLWPDSSLRKNLDIL